MSGSTDICVETPGFRNGWNTVKNCPAILHDKFYWSLIRNIYILEMSPANNRIGIRTYGYFGVSYGAGNFQAPRNLVTGINNVDRKKFKAI